MVAGSIVYVQPTKYLPKHERFTSSKVDTNRQIIYVFHLYPLEIVDGEIYHQLTQRYDNFQERQKHTLINLLFWRE